MGTSLVTKEFLVESGTEDITGEVSELREGIVTDRDDVLPFVSTGIVLTMDGENSEARGLRLEEEGRGFRPTGPSTET